ncbi:hypothetical protein HQ544_03405 [Candidatus Falkowbacteria bacterium]|nr:hypothetical protein [Candidatus Falkowbacteria bacterium]
MKTLELKSPKSHFPEIYDNTEKDLILVSPDVLDNKLRDFERNSQARGSIISDITLAVSLLIAVLTTIFKDFSFISGSTIKGAFVTGFLVVLVKVGYSVYKIFWDKKQTRTDIISSLKE